MICLALFPALVAGTAVCAQELTLGATEMDNLGVEFAQPVPAESVAVVDARAHVTIPPSDEHIVSSTLSGLVSRVHARVGQQVEEGDVLLEVRSAEFLTVQQEFLEALHYRNLAAAKLQRDEQLAAEGIIAERRLEETEADAAAAVGRHAEHRQLLKIAGMRDADVRRLETTQELQDPLMVRAPVDGAVLNLFVSAGESVDAVEALCRMADLETLWLDIHLPQEYAGRVRPDMRVAVRESAIEQPARVAAVGQAVDPGTQIVSVRAELDKSGHGLKPGQLVAVSLIDAGAHSPGGAARAIPAASLVRNGDAAYVFVRSPKGVRAMPVEIVSSADERAVVLNLDDEDVAVTGISALKALWLAGGETAE